jgi:hypothetical protein
MFERQQELEREQGFRGPATRYFGPLDDPAEARLVIRDMSVTLLLVAGVLLAMLWRAGWAALVIASVLALPSVLLLLTKSRPAAVVLAASAVGLAVWILIRGGQPNMYRLLVWLGILAITQRAFRATFRAHALAARENRNRGGA